MLSEPAAVTLRVAGVLDSLGIPYLIGGSFASAIHGVARMTADVDLVADIRLEQCGATVQLAAIESSWFGDKDIYFEHCFKMNHAEASEGAPWCAPISGRRRITCVTALRCLNT